MKEKIVNAISLEISSPESTLGDWYRKHSYYKFNEGDVLILKNRVFGYGIRPVAVVNNYEIDESSFGKAGKYNITMHKDDEGDFIRWMEQNKIAQGVGRGTHNQFYFKWNIENRFKKASVNSIEEALDLYASIEVE